MRISLRCLWGVLLLTLMSPNSLAAGHDRFVFLRLADEPLAVEYVRQHREMPAFEQRDYVRMLKVAQAPLLDRLHALNVPVLWTYQKALNGVQVRTALKRSALLALPGVVEVHPVRVFEPLLDTSAPHVGSTFAYETYGRDGSGIHVGIIDSGIDYFHESFGGDGIADHYALNDDTNADDGMGDTLFFPTAKVVGGYDFVGSDYSGGGLGSPKADLDPMPDHKLVEKKGKVSQDFQQHGTHVAGIAAGLGGKNVAPGVAPGAFLWSLKVFSTGGTTLATAAIEWSLDPNGDDDISDALDVLNLSLGGSYSAGTQESTTASVLAIRNFVDAGGVVVAAAGNSGNLALSLSLPSGVPEAISVAGTHAPGEVGSWLQVKSPASLVGNYNYRMAHSKLAKPMHKTGPYSGLLKYAGLGCDPSDYPDDMAGNIALINRGDCKFAEKISLAAKQGSDAVIIANNEEGDPFAMKGNGYTNIPAAMISQANGQKFQVALEEGLPVYILVSNAIPRPELIDSTWGGSSRGPAFPFLDDGPMLLAKPDISAPGARIRSVKAGIGNASANNTGTSMAAPHIAGVMAILKQEHPDWSPIELKALLMNTAGLGPYHGGNPGFGGDGYKAPHSRGGAGTVGMKKALQAQVVAYSEPGVTVDFGAHVLSQPHSESREVQVVNKGDKDQSYNVTFEFNLPEAAERGVSVSFPQPVVDVPAKGSTTFSVVMDIEPALLRSWEMATTNPLDIRTHRGDLLTSAEYGGHVKLTPTGNGVQLKVPLYVLAKPVPELDMAAHCLGKAPSTMVVSNAVDVSGRAEFFTLVGQDANEPESRDSADIRAVGFRTAVIDEEDVFQFALVTYGARIHPGDTFFSVHLDVDGDNFAEFQLAALDEGLAKGQSQRSGLITSVLLSGKDVNDNGKLDAFTPVGLFDPLEAYWAITDLFSNTIVLTVRRKSLGLDETADPTLGFWVTAFDWDAGLGGPLDAADVVPDGVAAWKLNHSNEALQITANCGEWKFSPASSDVDEYAEIGVQPPICVTQPPQVLSLMSKTSDGDQFRVIEPLDPGTVSCPKSLDVKVEEASCRGTVDYFEALFEDHCSGQFDIEGPGGLPIGSNDVVLKWSTGWGDSDSCELQINVVDEEAPVLGCPDKDYTLVGVLPVELAITVADACDVSLEVIESECLSEDGDAVPCELSVDGRWLGLDSISESASTLSFTVKGTDQSDNATQLSCSLEVVHPASAKAKPASSQGNSTVLNEPTSDGGCQVSAHSGGQGLGTLLLLLGALIVLGAMSTRELRKSH